MLTNLQEIENYCTEDNWNGNDEWAVKQETINAAKVFLAEATVQPCEIYAEDMGYISMRFFVSNKHFVLVLIEEDVHTVALFTPEMNVSKKLQNKYIKRTAWNMQHLTIAYQYFC